MSRPFPPIRPASSSRSGRSASLRASSVRAGWHRFRAHLRRFDDSMAADVIGAAALFLMIWPFIL